MKIQKRGRARRQSVLAAEHRESRADPGQHEVAPRTRMFPPTQSQIERGHHQDAHDGLVVQAVTGQQERRVDGRGEEADEPDLASRDLPRHGAEHADEAGRDQREEEPPRGPAGAGDRVHPAEQARPQGSPERTGPVGGEAVRTEPVPVGDGGGDPAEVGRIRHRDIHVCRVHTTRTTRTTKASASDATISVRSRFGMVTSVDVSVIDRQATRSASRMPGTPATQCLDRATGRRTAHWDTTALIRRSTTSK